LRHPIQHENHACSRTHSIHASCSVLLFTPVVISPFLCEHVWEVSTVYKCHVIHIFTISCSHTGILGQQNHATIASHLHLLITIVLTLTIVYERMKAAMNGWLGVQVYFTHTQLPELPSFHVKM